MINYSIIVIIYQPLLLLYSDIFHLLHVFILERFLIRNLHSLIYLHKRQAKLLLVVLHLTRRTQFAVMLVLQLTDQVVHAFDPVAVH